MLRRFPVRLVAIEFVQLERRDCTVDDPSEVCNSDVERGSRADVLGAAFERFYRQAAG